MTAMEFKTRLAGKYPSFLAQDKAELIDIGEYVAPMSDSTRAQLFNAFRDDYDKAVIPRRAYFVKLFYTLGLGRSASTHYPPAEELASPEEIEKFRQEVALALGKMNVRA